MLIKGESSTAIAAAKAGMGERTARKYLQLNRLPSQCHKEHTWRTRTDGFMQDWPGIREMLDLSPGLEAKTIFEYMQRCSPGRHADGQLRTLQRRIKVWRATEGPGREVFFAQTHYPGVLGASDFTVMDSLGITIARIPFPHMLYHFVLTYSNWETFTVCFSESYESLSTGMQNALWELGGVPKRHRSDRLTAAVNKECNPEEFTQRYQGLLRHYGLEGEKIQANKAHENGDIEQRNHRTKRLVEQGLLLRGSNDFVDRDAYAAFLRQLFRQANAGRQVRLREELPLLGRLPELRLDDFRRHQSRVGPGSTLRLQRNTYTVHSRLIGEMVEARLAMDHIEIWYGQKKVDQFPRLRGEHKYQIDYRHIIGWLVRKPGAFANYRYRDALFPGSQFRIAYDQLSDNHSRKLADREYLGILELAANDGESLIEGILREMNTRGGDISLTAVKDRLAARQEPALAYQVYVAAVDLGGYDALLDGALEAINA